jgi:ABC-type nitrate/sulfonate/bicarbonate transport system permease component
MKRSANIVNNTVPYAAAVLFLAIWETGVRWGQVPPYILPSPSQIIITMISMFPTLLNHAGRTLEEALIGFAAAVVIAFCSAFVLNYSKVLYQAVHPLLIVSQTIPIITLAPLFVIWFGWGILPKVLVVILVCFFPIVISFLEGLRGVDQDLINLFKSMGAKRTTIFRMVEMPAALPAFFAGLKISASYSIMAAVIGEWLGAQQGLGYFMTITQKSFRVDRVLAAVVLIALLSLLLVKAVDVLEWILTPWNRSLQSWDID